MKKSLKAGLCRSSRKFIFGKIKGNKLKLSNWHHPAFLGWMDLIWKNCLRHWCIIVVLLNGTSLHWSHCPFFAPFLKGFFTRLVAILVVLQTIIESRQHADCGLLKILAKIRHSFRYLDVFSLFLHIFFYNFEVKITRNIKL